MEVQTVLHMTGGEGDTSYAMNSRPQEKVISKAKRIVQETVIDLYSKTLPTCFTIADLGCSSGLNSLSAISQIIDAIVSMSQDVGRPSPEFQVILNDLPGNDFNTLFKYIPHFVQKLNRDKGNGFVSCFISGVPGSFFERLFPSQSLNFVHSTYSLHYLSQVPPGIENNKGNIYISKTSPPNVYRAYLSQYQKDFKSFLSLRSKEIVPGGSMVITIMGRQSSDPASKECCWALDVLAHSLAELVSEGRVEVDKFNSFNWPIYFTRTEELQPIIEEEGSFHIDLLDLFEVKVVSDCDLRNGNEMLTKGQYLSKIVRAVTEVVIASNFGEDIIEDLFHKFADHMNKYLANGHEISTFNIIMSMTRK
ncbi:salicylate carboxymethyltransferase [Ranunculus cassubicifolius]